jgi:hypothetical protein
VSNAFWKSRYIASDVVQNVAKLFADDTRLYAAVNNTNDEIKLQGDIDRLMQCSKEWLLTFNKSKCKHVHFGPPNNAKYQMGGDIITQSYYFPGKTIPSVYYSLRETVFSNISSTLLLVDFMLVASGGVLIFRKDFIAIYLIYIVNNSKRFYHVRS